MLAQARQLLRAGNLSAVRELIRDARLLFPRAAEWVAFEATVWRRHAVLMRSALRNELWSDVVEYGRHLLVATLYRKEAGISIGRALQNVGNQDEVARLVILIGQDVIYSEEITAAALSAYEYITEKKYIKALGFLILVARPGQRNVIRRLCLAVAEEIFKESFNGDENKAKINIIEYANLNKEFIESIVEKSRTFVEKSADSEGRGRIYESIRRILKEKGKDESRPELEDILRVSGEYAIEILNSPFQQALQSAELAERVAFWARVDGLARDVREQISEEENPRKTKIPKNIKIIYSIWQNNLIKETKSDIFGRIWIIYDPFSHILMVCLASILVNSRMIFDMPAFPFGVIGACYWMCFRTAYVSAMTGGAALGHQLEHPPVRKVHIIVAQAMKGYVNYILAGAAMMVVASLMGMSEWPRNILLVFITYSITWMSGILFGLIFHRILTYYKAAIRVQVWFLRAIGLTSGAFYVSEQLPERISSVVLWNPMIHLVQIGRTSWFYGYNTEDASVAYLIVSLLFVGILAIGALISVERSPIKVI